MTLDTETEAVSEFVIKSEKGYAEAGIGPATRDKEGRIYFASLSGGRIYQFDPKQNKLRFLKGIGNTKDGIVVAEDGTIWITETTGNLTEVNFSK